MTIKKSDLADMSLPELRQLQNAVAAAIATQEKKALKEAKAAIEKTAREMGFSIGEIFGTDAAKNIGKQTVSAPKYADPADPARTWTGRGRKPNWIKAYLDQGKSLDDLAI